LISIILSGGNFTSQYYKLTHLSLIMLPHYHCGLPRSRLHTQHISQLLSKLLVTGEDYYNLG